MKKWNMIIDVAECTNCNLCTLAAMDEYVGNDWPGYSAPMPKHGHKWINILQKERGQVPMIDIAYVPTMCNHCDNAPCMAKGGGAVKKRDDGIVLIDPDKAKGRKDLVEACPYGHIWWNEELQLPQIWPFDAHLLDQGWQQTRGQQSCPTGAMRAIKVEDDEMARMARDEGLEVMKPELGTKPRVYYRISGAIRNASSAARVGGGERRGRLRRGRDACGCSRTAHLVARNHERQLRRLQIRQARREFRPLRRRDFDAAAAQENRRGQARRRASISARSGCS